MTQRGKPRDLAKEQYWRQIIARWQASQLSIRAFCERHGLAATAFHTWRRTLHRRAQDQQLNDQGLVAGQAAPLFVPVRLPSCAINSAPLELVLPGGLCLRLSSDFDSVACRRLLAILRETLPC